MITKVLEYMSEKLHPDDYIEYVIAAMQKVAFVAAYGGNVELQSAAALSDMVILEDLPVELILTENPWLTKSTTDLMALFSRHPSRPSWGDWADEINKKVESLKATEVLLLLADRVEHITETIRKIPILTAKHDDSIAETIRRGRLLVAGARIIRLKVDCGNLRIVDAASELEVLLNSLHTKLNYYRKNCN